MFSVFTFLPHHDLADEPGQVRLLKRDRKHSVVTYTPFTGSSPGAAFSEPSSDKPLCASLGMAPLPRMTRDQNVVVLNQWKSH